ncbi:YqjF family protein [Alicyclobacillus hesperidum]|uniref:YqjF family protein n=1 Tax=Alicyclobacillus hesperidum TaxID=89784 RepID=UPI0007190C18|nr:DUF2071 domain-containing protein [Alicyclobacillus hesperidum]
MMSFRGLYRVSWVMEQTWQHLLFAHWPVAARHIQPLLPVGLEVDTYDGTAWVSAIPFYVTRMHLRGLPALPGLADFPECNLRTYVTYRGTPGVYFFRLDAGHVFVPSLGRIGFHVPYQYARFYFSSTHQQTICRFHANGHLHRGGLACTYQPIPTAEPFTPSGGSLEAWLVNRFHLFTYWHERLWRGDLAHSPWQLRKARWRLEHNSLFTPFGFAPLAPEPLLFTAQPITARIWPLIPA